MPLWVLFPLPFLVFFSSLPHLPYPPKQFCSGKSQQTEPLHSEDFLNHSSGRWKLSFPHAPTWLCKHILRQSTDHTILSVCLHFPIHKKYFRSRTSFISMTTAQTQCLTHSRRITDRVNESLTTSPTTGQSNKHSFGERWLLTTLPTRGPVLTARFFLKQVIANSAF